MYNAIASVLPEVHYNNHVVSVVVLTVLTILSCILIHKSVDKSWIIYLSKKLHTRYGNIIFLMAGILWASSVSVFGSDIKKQIFESDSFSWESSTFFITVMIAVITGALHYVGQQHKERASQARPPLNAIRVTSKKVSEVNNILTACLFDWVTVDSKFKNNSITEEEISSFLKTLSSAQKYCLKSLLYIAHAWDENNENVIFNSNVFKVADSRKLIDIIQCGQSDVGPIHSSTFSVKAIEESPFFLFSDNWLSKLERADYLLIGEQTLSVSLRALYGAEPECQDLSMQNTPPICMPFSETTGGQCVKQPNLHGAPTARDIKRPVYISDIRSQLTATFAELKSSPLYKSHYSDRFESELRRYYEADPTKSILSIPIYMYDVNKILARETHLEDLVADRPVVCITNVYSNKINMFAHDDMANSFCDLVKPISYVMSLLVSLTLKCVELQANSAAK